MLAASGLYNKGAGCVRIVLRGSWLHRDCMTRVLAASGLYNQNAACIKIVLQECWLHGDSIARVLAASGLYEGAGCVEIV